MRCHIACLFVIGLIATCTGDEVESLGPPGPDKPNEGPPGPDKPNEGPPGPDKPSEGPPGHDKPNEGPPGPDKPNQGSVPAASATYKQCQQEPNKAFKGRDNETPNLACRNGEVGVEACKQICNNMGFKLGQCKNSGNRPNVRSNNQNSCVCSNDGKHGLIAKEYEGPPSLRHKKGYFKNFFPMRGGCSECSCYKGCEDNSSKMFRDNLVSAGGQCVQGTCVCLRAWIPVGEGKFAKRRFANVNRNKPHRKF